MSIWWLPGSSESTHRGGMTSPLGMPQVIDHVSATSSSSAEVWRGRLTSLLPGVGVSALATAVAIGINAWLPTLSPLLIAIVIGAVAANVMALPPHWRPGLQFSAKRLLRIGVALLGLQLMLSDILRLGAGMVFVVVAI